MVQRPAKKATALVLQDGEIEGKITNYTSLICPSTPLPFLADLPHPLEEMLEPPEPSRASLPPQYELGAALEPGVDTSWKIPAKD